ncbi:T9SS type A sorting domain-containing protein [Arundinibacter roseus]|uniref:T9SS type A sorting domain-containing protein n=1 Tax=Arundinibacter roseus TaxID=2070510 RepID=A0A4R4KE79_9BACT|nr:T9SS type A sorting domain-containing protein [Arundinibacter roseus]TDB66003.1 T9SS type A sorting domain-containing protein [Arundinibacter roseus]
MKFTIFLAVIFQAILVVGEVMGQISISVPTNRTVLQRDKNNAATVYIRGAYSQPIDRIEVQLRAINGGATSDWITIQNNPQGGTYSGQLDWTGGWYEMEVRGRRGDQVVGSSTLQRFGIGEVFLIAGQSNAQGYFNYGGPGASDDRVNCVNHYNSGSISELPAPQFIHLNSDSYIAPRGNSAWSWGRLGDRLTQRLGVPVLFYNVAWHGSAVQNWRQSINGTAYSVYNGEPFQPSGMPYGNLRLSLQYYIPITGLRAILWHQGEADNFTKTSQSSYTNDLRAIIDQTRGETGRNISWVIARCSYDNQRGSDAAIINAQNETVANTSNTFYGPETDRIQAPRPDGAHFQDGGLYELGDAWNDALTDDFFSRSEPFRSAVAPRITVACADNNSVSLTIEGENINSIQWNNGRTDSKIWVGGGRYVARVRDSFGNILSTPELQIPDQVQPSVPTINLDGSNTLCQGSTLALTASTSENIRWNTGQTEQRITTNAPNTFWVSTQNVYGCEAVSAPVTIGIFSTPPPPRPSVSVQGATTFCQGGKVELRSNAEVRSAWSNGQEGAVLTVTQSGDYRVRAIDQNGCPSPDSDPISVTVNALPVKPTIATSRNPTFCAGENVQLTSSYTTGNRWNTTSAEPSIVVNQSGEFSVSVTDANGCVNTSDVVRVRVNPLPEVPTIAALRPTTFCDRDYSLLKASPAHSYQWSNGSNQQEINVKTPGNYSLTTTDANGCTSPASAPIQILVNPLPAQPTIEAVGPTTFCADQSITLKAPASAGYVWSNGATTQELSTNIANSYWVVTRNEFGCNSDPSPSISLTVLPLPQAPTTSALGPTVFCDGDQVELVVNGTENTIWNTGATEKAITATESGNYSARVIGTNGCFSPFSTPIRLDVKRTPPQPTIVQAGTFTLAVENGIPLEEYVWKKNNTQLPDKSAAIKVNQTGTFSVYGIVEYSATLSCLSEESDVFTFALPLDGSDGVSIYPNPTTDGRLTIETLENLENTVVQIFDAKGVQVQHFNILVMNERKYLDLSLLPNGIYFVRLISGTLSSVKKVIIQQ